MNADAYFKARKDLLDQVDMIFSSPQYIGTETKARVERLIDIFGVEARRLAFLEFMEWGQERWDSEVRHRPDKNVYKKCLSATWFQVINHARNLLHLQPIPVAVETDYEWPKLE